MPTFLPFFKIPFIWGPLGGGDAVPKAYLKTFPLKQRIVQGSRYFLKATSFLNPLVSFPSKKAVAILARTENNTEVIPKKYRGKVKVILETAMTKDIFNYQRKKKDRNYFELIVTGRLVPFKNVITAVEALRFIPKNYRVHLTIIGKGPEKKRILEKIKKYGLEERIELIPEIPREEVLQKLTEADIYVFPSLREGGSWALMEGMAIGLPVVCLNWTGMNIITDENSAIRIEPSNPEQTPKDFAKAICRLMDDEALREKMGKSAKLRIQKAFNWEVKGQFMDNLLQNLDSSYYREGNQ